MASILKVDQLQKPDGSTPTAADLGIDVAGSVVQVVHASNQNNAASSGGANNALQVISVDITPKLPNSKFFITYHATAVTDQEVPFATWVTRNGTKVGVESTSNNTYASIATSGGNAGDYSNGDAPDTVTGSMVDTPNTTSPITYAVYLGTRRDGAYPYRLGYSGNYGITIPDATGWQLSATHKITVMEIAQ